MYYILIPVFNESLNIEQLGTNLFALPIENKYFVFVDDCSTDNTCALIERIFSFEKFSIIKKDKNYGPGHSFNLGFEWILNHSQNESDLVITLEGDNTSDLSILPNMLSISSIGYNLVLASVYVQGGGFDHTSWFRKTLSFIANMFFRFLFDVKVQTLSSFYRIYHIELLKKIKLQNEIIIAESGFLCMLEILLKAIKLNAKIIEVPMVLYTMKRKGKSKMKILKTTLSYIRLSVKHKKLK